jgi:hypothetical protein
LRRELEMSCEGFFDEYVSWIEGGPTHRVRVAFVSNEKDCLCSYIVDDFGSSNYQPMSVAGEGGLAFIIPAQFEQKSATQVFNYRRFDFERADNIGLRITVSNPPHIRLQLNSLGGAKIAFYVVCEDGVLKGSHSGTSFLISLQNIEVPA